MRHSGERRLVILTEGQFAVHNAKTAFGVIRFGTEPVVAVLDSTIAGRNVSEWLPGHDIPAVATLDEALVLPGRPTALLIGIAPTGGKLPAEWRATILAALGSGLDVLSGLHQFLGDDPEFAAAARASGASSSTTAARQSGQRRPSGAAMDQARRSSSQSGPTARSARCPSRWNYDAPPSRPGTRRCSSRPARPG